MPHTPNHRDERRQIADNLDQKLGLGYRIGQGLRRAGRAVNNALGSAAEQEVNNAQQQMVLGANFMQRANRPTTELAAGFAGRPPPAPPQPVTAADFQAPPRSPIIPPATDTPAPDTTAAPPTGVRRQDLYTVQPGTDPNRVEFTDTGTGTGTFEGANARQRLADGTGSLTIMPAEDVSRALRAPSPETAAALSAARAAAADRGDFEAIRLSNMTPEQRTQWQTEKQAARARDDRAQLIRGLRRDAAGSGRAGYESYGAQFADAQKRRAAREQLKLIADQDAAAASAQADVQAAQLGAEGRLQAAETAAAGRVEAANTAAGVRRQTEKDRADRERQARSEERAFDTLDKRFTDEKGRITDPDGLALGRANLEARLSGDPEASFKLDTPSGQEARLAVKRKLLEATNANRNDSFFKKLNEWIHARNTTLDEWVSDPSLEGISIDGDRVRFDPPPGSPPGTVGADIPISELRRRLGDDVATATLAIRRLDNQQVRR